MLLTRRLLLLIVIFLVGYPVFAQNKITLKLPDGKAGKPVFRKVDLVINLAPGGGQVVMISSKSDEGYEASNACYLAGTNFNA